MLLLAGFDCWSGDSSSSLASSVVLVAALVVVVVASVGVCELVTSTGCDSVNRGSLPVGDCSMMIGVVVSAITVVVLNVLVVVDGSGVVVVVVVVLVVVVLGGRTAGFLMAWTRLDRATMDAFMAGLGA